MRWRWSPIAISTAPSPAGGGARLRWVVHTRALRGARGTVFRIAPACWGIVQSRCLRRAAFFAAGCAIQTLAPFCFASTKPPLCIAGRRRNRPHKGVGAAMSARNHDADAWLSPAVPYLHPPHPPRPPAHPPARRRRRARAARKTWTDRHPAVEPALRMRY